jgi:hypothetical protein
MYALLSVLLALVFASFAMASSLPSRAECIVAYEMNWSASHRPPGDVLNALEIPRELATQLNLAGIATPSYVELYLQFTRQCELGRANAARIVAQWSKVPGAPSFRALPGHVVPGPTTIDIRGPHWRN